MNPLDSQQQRERHHDQQRGRFLQATFRGLMPTQHDHFDVYGYVVIEVGGPACSRVFRRHQPCAACGGRLRIIAALTEPKLDSTLSKRNRATGPAVAAVRVRRLTF